MATSGGNERRQDERRGRAFDAFFRPAGEPRAEWQYGVILDLSRGGAAVRTANRLASGAQVEVLIMGEAGDTLVSIVALVRHVRPLGTEQWVFGCQFARALGEAEAAALWPEEAEENASNGPGAATAT